MTAKATAIFPEDHLWQCKCGEYHFRDERCFKCRQTLKGERRKLEPEESILEKRFFCPSCGNIPAGDSQVYCPCCGVAFVAKRTPISSMAVSLDTSFE